MFDISKAIKGWIFDSRDSDSVITRPLHQRREPKPKMLQVPLPRVSKNKPMLFFLFFFFFLIVIFCFAGGKRKKHPELCMHACIELHRLDIDGIFPFHPSASPSPPSKFLIPPFSHSLLFILSLHPSFFVFFTSINLFRGPSIIHLPSREVFPEGKLLWRPAWPRAASDWPSACLPFCILRCLFNKEQSECDFQGRVPVIVALTSCLSNDPHYGASDSSLKGLIYEYAGTVAPQASTHQPASALLPSLRQHPQTIHTCAWAFAHVPCLHMRQRVNGTCTWNTFFWRQDRHKWKPWPRLLLPNFQSAGKKKKKNRASSPPAVCGKLDLRFYSKK